jgi:hypothetical protein
MADFHRNVLSIQHTNHLDADKLSFLLRQIRVCNNGHDNNRKDAFC